MFFNEALHDAPEIVREGYRRQYCHSANPQCARFVVASIVGREHVPVDLSPVETTRAAKVMQEQGLANAHLFFQ
jgi:hypothetical protein